MAVDAGVKGRRPAPSVEAGKRRTKGAGGVVFLRDGVWRVDVEVSPDPVTGRRRRVSRTVRGTRHDAGVALARLRVADHEKRLPSVGTSARSVRAAFDLYIATIEKGLIEMAPRGLLTVRSAANTLSSAVLPDGREFGRLRLSRLTWQEIEGAFAALRSAGRGAAWIRRCATVLNQTLELARKRGLIDSNPAKDAARPRTVRTKPWSPSTGEMRELIASVRVSDEEMGDALVVLAATGVRKGELLALQFSDIDFVGEEIHVAAALSDGGPRVGIIRKETKRADWRDVPLTTSALAAIQRRADRLQALTGSAPAKAAYVFSWSPDGATPWRPDSFTDRWTVARGSSEVTIRDVRHFAATTMLDAGESYRTVAEILGNSENTLRLHYDGRVDVGKRKAIVGARVVVSGAGMSSLAVRGMSIPWGQGTARQGGGEDMERSGVSQPALDADRRTRWRPRRRTGGA